MRFRAGYQQYLVVRFMLRSCVYYSGFQRNGVQCNAVFSETNGTDADAQIKHSSPHVFGTLKLRALGKRKQNCDHFTQKPHILILDTVMCPQLGQVSSRGTFVRLYLQSNISKTAKRYTDVKLPRECP